MSRIFEEICTLLPNLPYDLDSLISFYEILVNTGVKTDHPPKEVLNNSLEVNFNNFTSELIPDISVVGIHFSSSNTDLESNDFFEITIEPKKGSSSNRYYVQMRYQTKDKDNIARFDTKSTIYEMIKNLEQE